MAMMEYSAFPIAPALLEPHHQIFSLISEYILMGSYPSAEKQSVYSTTLADWATNQKCVRKAVIFASVWLANRRIRFRRHLFHFYFIFLKIFKREYFNYLENWNDKN